MKTKKLTNKEFNELTAKWQSEGCLESRNKVVEHSMGVAYKIAYKIALQQDVDDVAHSAIEGVIRACDQYDSSKGEWIQYAYYHALSKAWSFVFSDRQVPVPQRKQKAIIDGKEEPEENLRFDDLEEAYDHSDTITITRAIEKLSAIESEAVIMLKVNGFSLKDLSSINGASVAANSLRAQKGLQKLKDIVRV